ncbi:hypothetical protein [Caudoviricetes sp.]|nr:hypothetical protein [Caudoviricetes sp.]UOF79148.1 hypothetical protein [Caudoviricetes sp.]
MPTLTVSSTYAAGVAPTETQIDASRDSLHTFFNTTKMNEANVAAASMLFTTLGDAADNTTMKWGTGAEGTIGFVSATPAFNVKSTHASGSVRFTSKISATEQTSLTLSSAQLTTIGTGGVLRAGTGQGYTSYELMYLLARYRKPRLEYSSASVVSIENNTGTASETIIVGRDRLWTVVDRTCSLATTANGYDAADTGAAVSGIEDGLAEAANTWYYIYAVEVQYGSDANGSNCILCATTTSPLQANCATLDTEYGAGKWVYLGVIRNGFNDGVTTTDIVPFVYDGYGHIEFTAAATDGVGAGVRVISASTDADSTWTVALGTGAAEVPSTASQVRLLMYRADDGFSMQYEDSGGTDLFISGAKTRSPDPGYADLLVPVISGAVLRLVRDTAGAHAKKAYISGLTDHYA